MTKISKKWMNLDFNDPGGLTADDIPFSAEDSLKLYLKATTGDAAEWVTIYVSPNGTGSGESFNDPTTLEAVRQKFDNRHAMLKIMLTSGGEYVLQDTYRVYGLVIISFDNDNATLDWANNPPIICTPHTTSSYIAFDPNGSKTCQAHNYSESPFSVGSESYLRLSDVVVRGTTSCVSAHSFSALTLANKFRCEVWSVPRAVRYYSYPISVWSGGKLFVTANSTDYSDDVGVYVYLPDSDPPTTAIHMAVASGSGAVLTRGWLNMYTNWKPTTTTVECVQTWNMSWLQLYDIHIKHTNCSSVFHITQGSRLGTGTGIGFYHDYDPTVSDHRSPMERLIKAIRSDVQMLCYEGEGNTHYCTDVPIKAIKSKCGIYYPPKLAIHGNAESIVYFEAAVGVVERPVCDDITYGSATMPVYAIRNSDLFIDYKDDNPYTTSLLGDATSAYGTFTAYSGSRIAVRTTNATLNTNIPICAYPVEEAEITFTNEKLTYKG